MCKLFNRNGFFVSYIPSFVVSGVVLTYVYARVYVCIVYIVCMYKQKYLYINFQMYLFEKESDKNTRTITIKEGPRTLSAPRAT